MKTREKQGLVFVALLGAISAFFATAILAPGMLLLIINAVAVAFLVFTIWKLAGLLVDTATRGDGDAD